MLIILTLVLLVRVFPDTETTPDPPISQAQLNIEDTQPTYTIRVHTPTGSTLLTGALEVDHDKHTATITTYNNVVITYEEEGVEIDGIQH